MRIPVTVDTIPDPTPVVLAFASRLLAASAISRVVVEAILPKSCSLEIIGPNTRPATPTTSSSSASDSNV